MLFIWFIGSYWRIFAIIELNLKIFLQKNRSDSGEIAKSRTLPSFYSFSRHNDR